MHCRLQWAKKTLTMGFSGGSSPRCTHTVATSKASVAPQKPCAASLRTPHRRGHSVQRPVSS
ncbi:MAG: hypothetical protein IKJ78_09015 [Bacteroidales bacterium]|nr:hypothetical protein [Bacteroidales bacterium]